MNCKRCSVIFTLLLTLALPAQEIAGNKGGLNLADYTIIAGEKPTVADCSRVTFTPSDDWGG